MTTDEIVRLIVSGVLSASIGVAFGGAVATFKGVAPLKKQLAEIITTVAVLDNKVGALLEWRDKWEDRLYQQRQREGDE